jgi:hypothetical protein
MRGQPLIGRRIGRLTVVRHADDIINKSGTISRAYECLCDCGKYTIVRQSNLSKGASTSCGCYRNAHRGDNWKTHLSTPPRLHNIWLQIRQRCQDKNLSYYNNYGGRGITVCDEWSESYEIFRDWALANGYRDDLTIDRIDNNGNYEPSNCRWTTMKEQNNNRRTNLILEISGIKQTLAQWCAITGISYKKAWNRLARGWAPERAVDI